MNRFFKLLIVALSFVGTACSGSGAHFITDSEFRAEVKEHFQKRRTEFSEGYEDVFAIVDRKDLTTKQREALEFLYAYSTLSDLGNYDGEFFLENVDLAFMIKDHFPWGGTIPEEIFRDFVLPIRASSEYLDSSREVFFNELKDRVAGLSMYDAALEVNHWCHEKVTYQGTDRRTSAPLATMKSSYGRCGEEASFATTAMRAVGIPSRVVMTPRWAHTDDNHAWIEVWIDGQWYYTGACEPEPELNVAWFDGPVKRTMMVNTTVQGPYKGESEVVSQTPLYSRLNLIDIYAPTKRLEIVVVDERNEPVDDAKVSFRVFNSADLNTIYSYWTASDGKASLTTGKGDMVVWATKDNKYGYIKCTADQTNATLMLNRMPGKEYAEDEMIVPPVEQPFVELDPEKVEANRVRLAQEDSLRNAYMATFITEEDAKLLARELGLDEEDVWKYLRKSQGNHAEIAKFIKDNRSNRFLYPFLDALSDKDLRDTPAEYLSDHINAALQPKEPVDDKFFARYVLSPRIESEIISPWRSYFTQPDISEDLRFSNAGDIISYIKERVKISNEQYYACPLTPIGVFRIGAADIASRDIFFVALCRLNGIPAQIEPTANKLQYYENGVWHDVKFAAARSVEITPQGALTLTNDKSNIILPVYGRHFSVAKYSNGEFHNLNLSSSLRNFPATVNLDEGYYRIMTASRANEGSVKLRNEYINVKEGEKYTVNIDLPEFDDKLLVKGVIDMNAFVWLEEMGKTSLKTIANNRGLVLCFMDPDKEPTKHVLQELPKFKEQLEEWGGGILFLVPSDIKNASFDPTQFHGLPTQAEWSVDEDRQKLNEAARALKVDFKNNFPFIMYVTKVGGILYDSQGYRIGIGEDLLQIINQEKESYNK